MGADAGDRRLQPGDVAGQRRRAGGDLALKVAACERRRQAALGFDRLKERPGLVAKRAGHRLERAGAGGRVADKAEIGFPQEDELAVAGETARKAVRKADRKRVRQNGDAVGAAEAGRERRRRAAHDVHIDVARRHHAPGALGLHMRRARLEAAGFLNPRPENPQRAEFRQRRQFIRVGREPERDQRARFAQRRSGAFKQPQAADRGAERKGELLRRSAAGAMDRAGVGDQERPAEAFAPERHRSLEATPRLSAPVRGEGSARARPKGIEPERDRAILGPCPRAFDQRAKTKRLVGAVGPKIEFETRPRVERRSGRRPCEARPNRTVSARNRRRRARRRTRPADRRRRWRGRRAPGRWPRRGQDDRAAR